MAELYLKWGKMDVWEVSHLSMRRKGFPRENSRDRNKIRVPGTCGNFVELVLICKGLNVFNS